MNEVLHDGMKALGRAEDDLRALLGRAAANGDYDTLGVLAEWAREVQRLLDDGTPKNGRPYAAASAPAARTRQTSAATGSVRRKRRAARLKKRASSPRAEYPKFLRSGDQLVKIGWSKSEKATYEHKAPRRVIEILVGALTKCGASGSQFTMEETLPLKDNGTEIPAYQVYLCLAWLRKEALVNQHGRQGYSVPASAHLGVLADKRFEALPPR